MTKDEALKKAFKQAFQLGQDYWYQADHEYVSQNKKSDVTRAKFEQLMEDAIKEALAQPEQEPVKFEAVWDSGPTNKDYEDAMRLKRLQQLTSPLQRKPLTDEEIHQCFLASEQGQDGTEFRKAFARAIEAAHGIKGEA